MSIGINTVLSGIKDIISLVKELKPVFLFVNGYISLTQSQIRTLKLFLYSVLFISFIMGMLLSITSMMVHLPLVGNYLKVDWIGKISLIAEYCRNTVLLIGYLFSFVVLNLVFIYSVYKGVKRLFREFFI